MLNVTSSVGVTAAVLGGRRRSPESVARPSSKPSLVPERLFDTLKHDRTSAHRL